MRVICPRCDGQGEVEKAKVTNLRVELNICDECDACWEKDEEITLGNFKYLNIYLEQRGINYHDAKIEYLGYLEK